MFKYAIPVIFAIVFLSSCKKDTYAPTENLDEKPTDTAELLYTGTFGNGPYGSVSGLAQIYQLGDSLEIKLTDFNSSNGPDLHVFLSQKPMPNSDIDLGELKSTTGNQIYKLSYTPDLNAYTYISIHCVAFNHLFGSARFN